MLANKVRRALLAPLAIAFVAASASSALADNLITIKNFDFHPMTITIHVGDSVTWKNADGEPHTVTSVDGLFRSGALDENDSFTFKFTKAGTFKYMCSIHPRMMASVIVQ